MKLVAGFTQDGQGEGRNTRDVTFATYLGENQLRELQDLSREMAADVLDGVVTWSERLPGSARKARKRPADDAHR